MNLSKKGPWTVDEDRRLTAYMQSHSDISWPWVPVTAASIKSGSLKPGNFTDDESNLIAQLYSVLGNRWSVIAAQLPGRTTQEVKIYWNNQLKCRKMSTRSISGEKVDKFLKSSDSFMSNDEDMSDASEIHSELSSNAGNLWSDDLTFEPNINFGLNQDLHLVSPPYLNFDQEPELPLVSQFNDPENGTSVGHSNNIVVPSPAVSEDHHYEHNAISGTSSDNDLGQSTSVIPPPVIREFPQVEYSYETDTTLNDTDDIDKQRNGELRLSLEVIKQHFHMNMDDAADSLKVSRSTLKRICRKYGIKRWPCHKRRKISNQQPSNINNLNNDINTVRCSSSSFGSVIIKAIYQDDIMKFPLSVLSKLDDLREKLANRLNLGAHNFKLKYKDGDGDLVLIACEEDLCGYFESRLSHKAAYDILVYPVIDTCNKAMDRSVSSFVEEIDNANNNLIDPEPEDAELKNQQLGRYKEFVKKKGKMTKEAQEYLLEWSSRHDEWPYPSESEKMVLDNLTALDQEQIKYWFMN